MIEVKEQDDERGVQGCSVLQVVATAVIERSESGLEEAVDDENLLELGTIHSHRAAIHIKRKESGSVRKTERPWRLRQ